MNNNPETTGESDLTRLKARADMLGIKYHPNIGAAKLAAKVNLALAADEGEELPESVDDVVTEEEVRADAPTLIEGKTPGILTAAQYKKQEINRRRRKANQLIRVRVTCMNPNKRDWEGEIISVGSAKLGTYKKYVPFNVDEGYHIPYIVYLAMLDRKCTVFQTVRGPRGDKIRKGKLVNEFNIEVLPPLTKEELEDLKKQQAMAGSID